MQVSAEIRWFWKSAAPVGFARWFQGSVPHQFLAGGGPARPRVDVYAVDPMQAELGIKRRGGKEGIEVKGLVKVTASPALNQPFYGPIEVWTKWSVAGCDVRGPTIAVNKTRWLRKLDLSQDEAVEIRLDENGAPIDGVPLPSRGCNVELTRITLDSHETGGLSALRRSDQWGLSSRTYGEESTT